MNASFHFMNLISPLVQYHTSIIIVNIKLLFLTQLASSCSMIKRGGAEAIPVWTCTVLFVSIV